LLNRGLRSRQLWPPRAFHLTGWSLRSHPVNDYNQRTWETKNGQHCDVDEGTESKPSGNAPFDSWRIGQCKWSEKVLPPLWEDKYGERFVMQRWAQRKEPYTQYARGGKIGHQTST
ncbi:MAG: hypothetical protein WA821_19945, partial [Anaerolineales bacterium]